MRALWMGVIALGFGLLLAACSTPPAATPAQKAGTDKPADKPADASKSDAKAPATKPGGG